MDRLSHLIHRIYFTTTWPCRVAVSNFIIFPADLAVRESILCTKVTRVEHHKSGHGMGTVASAMLVDVYLQHI